VTDLRLPLRGPGGEPIDLLRTFVSHGVAELPPMAVDETEPSLTITLPTATGGARTVRVDRGPRRFAAITVLGRAPGARTEERILEQIRHVLRFDEDLSGFYAMAKEDTALSWATTGAGRMIRSATVFEEVVKTICTTNCAWSATERMVGAIVEDLGTPAPGAPQGSALGRAFPSAEAMAVAGERFYRDVARAGYRSTSLASLARRVTAGDVDLESLGRAGTDELSDGQLEERLLALPGVGPYAAAHIMTMLGRYSRLILDSWTRPKYAALVGRKRVSDTTIERRFRHYGRFAGLAFWLFLTRDWVEGGRG